MDTEILIVIAAILGVVSFVFQSGRWFERTQFRRGIERYSKRLDEIEDRLSGVEAGIRSLEGSPIPPVSDPDRRMPESSAIPGATSRASGVSLSKS